MTSSAASAKTREIPLLATLSVMLFIWIFTISFSWWCESGSNITTSLSLLRSSGLKYFRTCTNKRICERTNTWISFRRASSFFTYLFQEKVMSNFHCVSSY